MDAVIKARRMMFLRGGMMSAILSLRIPAKVSANNSRVKTKRPLSAAWRSWHRSWKVCPMLLAKRLRNVSG
jgi:hypothetical protein